MQLTRLLLSLGALSCAAWAQDSTEEKDNMKGIVLRTHSLSVPYLDSDMSSRWWDFGGNCAIRTDQYVRLTPDRSSKAGWLFSRVPLTATNWEIEVEFKIKGKGNLYGDGFAMWLTKERAQPGDVFGHADKFEGLGIFFDTYKNNRPGTQFPYVMAMLGDGQTVYDKGNDGKANELAGCSARGIRNKDFPTKVRVTYFQEQSLVVQLQYKSEGEWTPCFEVPNVKIPSVSYLGFSAETGELSDAHDIISVQTKNIYDSTGRAQRMQEANKERLDRKKVRKGGKSSSSTSSSTSNRSGSSSGSWLWFFAKIFLFLSVCGGGYVGYTAYRSSKRRSSRF